MAYDPYKSLLANATREHLKRNTDLNTHLVGNVFLPAIDSQHKKKTSTSTASLKHLKVIEQCIMAENNREELLAKCTTIKERRFLTKKFQVQRERERELIQTLMLGNYPEQHHEIKVIETEVVAATTPPLPLNTGLSIKVAKPDRVFRKADVPGGALTANPHVHKKFKLPECNGSPSKRASARVQAAASANLSSSSRKAPPSTTREAHTVTDEPPIRKKRSPTRSACENSGRSLKTQVNISTCSDGITTAAEAAATSPSQRAQSPCISPLRLSKVARATPQLSSLIGKPAEMEFSDELVNASADSGGHQNQDSSVEFTGARSFSEAQRMAMSSDANLVKEKCEKVFDEIATQATPRLLENVMQENGVKKVSSRPELPPMDPFLVSALTRDASAATLRRPQSDRATRQSFLESLPTQFKNTPDQKDVIVQHDVSANVERETTANDQSLAEVEDKSQVSEELPEDEIGLVDDGSQEAEYSDDEDHAAANDLAPDADTDEDLETDVAEILFDLVDLIEAAIAEEEKQKQKQKPSPRTVSPRPRSSMGRTTKYALRIQSLFRGYRARIAFRLALYEDALSCGVLGAMPGTIQGRSGWYLDPKRLMAYYFVIPEPDGEWEQKHTLRCSRLVLTPYEMRKEVLSKVPALLQQSDVEQSEEEDD